MVSFKQFLLENLYLYSPNRGVGQARRPQPVQIGFQMDNGPDRNTPIGGPSAIPNNNGILVAKFYGQLRAIHGNRTKYIQDRRRNISVGSHRQQSKLYIGYRMEHLDEDVMAVPKGNANYHAPPALRDDFHAVQPYMTRANALAQGIYSKGFSILRRDEYTNFIESATADFKKKIGNLTYDIIAYPESRSQNVRDIVRDLQHRVGAANCVIEEIEKVIVDLDDPYYYNQETRVYNLYEIDKIADVIAPFITRGGAPVPAQEVRNAIFKWIEEFTEDHYGSTLSTASDTRPISLNTIAGEIANSLRADVTPHKDRQAPGGHFDAYTKPHLKNQDTLNRINPILQKTDYAHERQKLDKHKASLEAAKSITPKTSQQRQQRDAQIAQLQGWIDRTEEKIRDISKQPPPRILFVDDNINTGDIYKQIKPTIDGVGPNVNVDFFFLLASNTYVA